MENYDVRVHDLEYLFGPHLRDFIQKLKEDDRLSELEDDIPDHEDCDRNRWNLEKAKAVLKILKKKLENWMRF